MKKKNITILAVETSCDDTGIAIIRASKNGLFNVLSNIVSSQEKIHAKWGGVFPTLAKREHQENLTPVLEEALKEAKLLKMEKSKIDESKVEILKEILNREQDLYRYLEKLLQKYKEPDIDAIAVTTGPGLEPCLWVGVNFAKAIAYYWNLPIIPINHIEGHIFINFLQKINENSKFQILNPKFPAICLIVSGGHTQIILMRNFGKYEILGETRDDAAGECFDKTARILGLGYPGGPIISKLAENYTLNPIPYTLKLPRPMLHTKDYDFSFSGLKTAVLYEVKKRYGQAPLRSAFSRTTEGRQYIKQMCVEIQQSIIDVLIKKTIKAAKDYNAKIPTMPTNSSILDKVGTKSSRIHDRIGTIILGGGVTANKELRKQFFKRVQGLGYRVQLLMPNTNLCTDNGLMVAVAGYFRLKQGKLENWSRWRSPDKVEDSRQSRNHRGSSTKSGKNIEVNANLGLQ
ncbi:tRNA (adenosine(37)-N6)-threonylcarbamoyltransferase complex transferase subunit TsaD [Patescibacteria group bacterium]|nr:tRNA (adenosine(37)-N6)-threonylcarbamoyltransferase complex transferase subunit TsaD [Patescibacteria group bacterium]